MSWQDDVCKACESDAEADTGIVCTRKKDCPILLSVARARLDASKKIANSDGEKGLRFMFELVSEANPKGEGK